MAILPLLAAAAVVIPVPIASASASNGSSVQPSFTDTITPALSASGALKFRPEIYHKNIFSTRVNIAVYLVNENDLPGKWHGECATSMTGPWTPAGDGSFSAEPEPGIGLGTSDATNSVSQGISGNVLHHLKSGTKYYCRFVAEDENETAEKTVEFTTLPAEKPEIAHYQSEASHLSTFPGQQGLGQPTAESVVAQVDGNGLETTYSFEYTTEPGSAGSWKKFSTGESGVITVPEDYAELEAVVTGLTPETLYYERLKATNVDGTVEEVKPFTTPTARPTVGEAQFRNVTGESAHVSAALRLRRTGLKSQWRLEYAASSAGPWTTFGSGTVSAAEAAEEFASISGALTGLHPASTYYVRVFAENEAGEGRNYFGEPILTETQGVTSFQTSGPPTAGTFAVHALHGETLRLLGAVNPQSTPSSDEQQITIEGAPTGGTFTLTFNGQTTAPIAFDASSREGPDSVEAALSALSSVEDVGVEGPDGGPYTVYFYGVDGEVSQPQITGDGSGLTPSVTPSRAVNVVTTQEGGKGYEAHYHFEYVSKEDFEKPGGEGGFAQAIATPAVVVGTGDSSKIEDEDVPGLKAGESYRYRIVAASTAPGDPVVDGAERVLTVPGTVTAEEPSSCPNESLRTGASARLPDCRAYEQVTPVNKEGTQDPFHYGGGVDTTIAAGEDGEHVLLENPSVNYGAGPNAGPSPYVFSRDPASGWQMTSASPEPETGVSKYEPQVFSPDLTQVGLRSEAFTSFGSGESPNVEFKAGPVGGPYTSVSVPRKDVPGGNKEGWVAASADFSKLVLGVKDHSLLGSPTGTLTGEDLYEYSGGNWSQVNAGIGTCGASIVEGNETRGTASSAHAVSANGSRVFFEAVPGKTCSAPEHLYERVDGTQTVDIGAYRFLAANAEGSKVLVEKRTGETPELLVYDAETEPAAPRPLPELTMHSEARFLVSEDFSTIYITSKEQLTPEAPSVSAAGEDKNIYRYDLDSETLAFVAQTVDQSGAEFASPDGRDLYFPAEGVEGVPGGALVETGGLNEGKGSRSSHGLSPAAQVYRYDSAEGVVQCMSCASPFDPEPKRFSVFTEFGLLGGGGGFHGPGALPGLSVASANGDFAFFDTPAALVSADVDGEVEPNSPLALLSEPQTENISSDYSPSSDVYEWRKAGIDGCTHIQGCVALVTSGRGGVLNVLIGTTPSGRDVFVYTNSQLVAGDDDSAGDVYDARIGGGFPPPAPRPVECEGDACSTPPSAPNDATPSSSTFTGNGNIVQPAQPATKPKATTKTTRCAKGKKLTHGRCVKQKKRKRKASANKSATRSSNSGRGK